ncbi:MAG: hypothetical protein ACREDS_01935 [Limisphaerales bacterium]
MKTAVTLILAALVLSGCKPASRPESLQPQTWEYAQFHFYKPDYNANLVTCVSFDKGDSPMGADFGIQIRCFELEDILNQIGGYGWEFCWKDGDDIIVKRPAGVFTNGNFMVIDGSAKYTPGKNE